MSLLRLIPTDPLSRLRLAVVLLMVVVLAPALFRLWCIQGLVRTIRIDGASMAETLYGDHFLVTCNDCGIKFRCDGENVSEDRLAVCPNCGFRDNELPDEVPRRGDRVLVDTWPYLWSVPKRGDLVMLVEPKTNETKGKISYAVKRVAALPLERLAIHNGDLLINGEPLQKSLKQLHQQALLVHDNDFLPTKVVDAQRWAPASRMETSWHMTPHGFQFVPVKGREMVEWLDYQHWHCSASPAPRTVPTTVQDNDSYNQANQRGLNPVRDLLLRCQVETDEGDVLFTLQDPPHRIKVHLKLAERRFQIFKNGSPVAGDKLPRSSGRFQLEAALCDGRFLFAFNRQVLAAFPYDGMPLRDQRETAQEGESPLRIGAYGDVEISHLEVWRDLYDLTPNYLGGDWQADAPLPEGRYFLLGDNSPVSVDSRRWGGGVAREEIVGRVIPLGR